MTNNSWSQLTEMKPEIKYFVVFENISTDTTRTWSSGIECFDKPSVLFKGRMINDGFRAKLYAGVLQESIVDKMNHGE